MDFHLFRTMFDAAKSRLGKSAGDFSLFYRHVNGNLRPLRNRGELFSLSYARSIVEHEWILAGRPYYKVWPAILPALTKLKLDIPASSISPGHAQSILVRFGKGVEPEMPFGSPTWRLYSIMASMVLPPRENHFRLFVVFRFDDGDGPCDTSDESFTVDLNNQNLESLIETEYIGFSDINNGRFAARIIASIFLMSKDPEFIKPDVLACDREAYNRYEEQGNQPCMDALVAKAAKQGIKGWRVGEVYETIPHLRRPHFALRHTGKGGAIPKIVPVRGSVVHRKKLTDVPTGYLTEDGEEVE